MNTLDSPVYEVKQNSQWYKDVMQREEDIERVFREINKEYGFENDGFTYYHPDYFGVFAESKDYEKFKEHLLKNPNSDDIYIFKKRSPYYSDIKKKLETIREVSPFKKHDQFGVNNLKRSQWIGDRWFFSVKKEELVKGEEVVAVDYKEYLTLVMDELDKENK